MLKDKEYYSQFKIKQYSLWDLYIHEEQYSLGRCYTFLKRSGPVSIVDLEDNECRELLKIIPKWHKTIEGLYGSSRYNTLPLFDEHLKVHLIPRFDKC